MKLIKINGEEKLIECELCKSENLTCKVKGGGQIETGEIVCDVIISCDDCGKETNMRIFQDEEELK